MALLDHTSFFVRQKTKLIEVISEFSIVDEHGERIGGVTEVGVSKAKKALKFLSSVDQFLGKKFSVVDADGSAVLALERPAKLMKSTVKVFDAAGAEIGSIAQQNVIGKIRFGFHDAAGADLGGIFAKNLRAWDFRIQDAGGAEVGRVSKEWGGVLKESFTTADNYHVSLSPSLTGTPRMLAFAAAVTIDTALKSDSRGLT